MKRLSLPTALLFGLLTAEVHAKAPRMPDPYWAADNNGPLEQAHADYLQANWSKMVMHARDALTAAPLDTDRLANVSALFDAAYTQLGGNKLPVDWKLPKEIAFLKVASSKTLVGVEGKPREIFSFGVLAEPKGLATVKQVQVIRFPDQVMLDREAGVGEWNESRGQRGPRFVHLGRYLPALPPPGLYLLNLELAGQKPVQGWFLLGEGPSNTDPTPKLTAPSAEDNVFHSPFPVFRWEDYRSPEYKKFEERKILLSVLFPYRAFGDAVWFAVFDPTTQKIPFGVSTPMGSVNKQGLEPGEYWLHLSFIESRGFGDIEISRESGQTLPIKIEK